MPLMIVSKLIYIKNLFDIVAIACLWCVSGQLRDISDQRKKRYNKYALHVLISIKSESQTIARSNGQKIANHGETTLLLFVSTSAAEKVYFRMWSMKAGWTQNYTPRDMQKGLLSNATKIAIIKNWTETKPFFVYSINPFYFPVFGGGCFFLLPLLLHLFTLLCCCLIILNTLDTV